MWPNSTDRSFPVAPILQSNVLRTHTIKQSPFIATRSRSIDRKESDGCIFQFGPNRLWIDKVPNLSHPDIWLEIETNDTEAASSFLKIHGVARRDEVENLREDFNGFFISDPPASSSRVGPEEV